MRVEVICMIHGYESPSVFNNSFKRQLRAMVGEDSLDLGANVDPGSSMVMQDPSPDNYDTLVCDPSLLDHVAVRMQNEEIERVAALLGGQSEEVVVANF